MFLLLFLIFWLTISGANFPSSSVIRTVLGRGPACGFRDFDSASQAIYSPLIFGMYRPSLGRLRDAAPMAIFFPLFTLLEDFGYLPG